MSGEPDWERVAATCEAVLLRMLEEDEGNPDVDRCLLPGVDTRTSD